MVTVKVDCQCGQSIEEAIRDCLEFAERCHCDVRCTMNDIHMFFVNTPIFGKTMEDRVKHYVKEFYDRLNDRIQSHKERWDEATG